MSLGAAVYQELSAGNQSSEYSSKSVLSGSQFDCQALGPGVH